MSEDELFILLYVLHNGAKDCYPVFIKPNQKDEFIAYLERIKGHKPNKADEMYKKYFVGYLGKYQGGFVDFFDGYIVESWDAT